MRPSFQSLRPLPVYLLLGLSASSVAAQRVPLEVGERVRVTVSDDLPGVKGTLSRVGDETLEVLEPAGGLRSLSYDDIDRLERSVGRRNRVGLGAAIGGGIAFGIGGTFGLLLIRNLCENDSCSGDYPKAFVIFGGLVGAGGAVLGALIGLAASGERWERIPIGPPGSLELDAGWSALLGGPTLQITITP